MCYDGRNRMMSEFEQELKKHNDEQMQAQAPEIARKPRRFRRRWGRRLILLIYRILIFLGLGFLVYLAVVK